MSIAVLLLEGPLIHKTITMRRFRGVQFILRENLRTKNGRLRYSMEAFANLQFDHQLLLFFIFIMTGVLSPVFLAEFSIPRSVWYLTKYVRAKL
jgi:hypothetical protein